MMRDATAAARPRAFIGSSKEHLEVARVVQVNLEPDIETRVWDQDVFHLSRYPLDELRTQLDESDFGVFVLAPDDVVRIRGSQLKAPRDNVVFELGLFAGSLGHERTFIVAPEGKDKVRLPSDLQGLTIGYYNVDRSDGSLNAALGAVCTRMRTLMKDRLSSVRQRDWTFRRVGYFTDFDSDFRYLIPGSKEMVLVFIHSRRWRETHDPLLREFVARKETRLKVFLPNAENHALITSLMSHFDDGPHIPELIADAYRYFHELMEVGRGRVEVRLFDLYPTYSLYGFDDLAVLALYPNTEVRRPVPTLGFAPCTAMGEFVLDDVARLVKGKRARSLRQLQHLREVMGSR